VAASALLVDYVMTVAVSVVSGVVAATSAFRSLIPYAGPTAAVVVVALALQAISASQAGDSAHLREQWERHDLNGPPLLAHIDTFSFDTERAVVTVFIPAYVVAHWWQNLLHNQTALRLKARLRRLGVVVVDGPYHLGRREHGWLAQPARSIADPPPR